MTSSPPIDIEPERHAIGWMFWSAQNVETAVSVLSPADFRSVALGEVFRTIAEQYEAGQPTDLESIGYLLRDRGVTEPSASDLVSMFAVSTPGHRKALDAVARGAALRRMWALGSTLQSAVHEPGANPTVLRDNVMEQLEAAAMPGQGGPPEELIDFDAFVDEPLGESSEWVIPGLLRRDWRCVLTATPGVGKSTLIRQLLLVASRGRHPLLPDVPIAPIRTLFLEIENPDDALKLATRPWKHYADDHIGASTGNCAMLDLRRSGIDVLSPVGQSKLHGALAWFKPDVLAIGPIYKIANRGDGDHESHARALQALLDRLRRRFGFALLLEHHVPKEGRKSYGSAAWGWWPELAFHLELANDARSVSLQRPDRADRVSHMWPAQLERSSPWPWVGVWRENGSTVKLRNLCIQPAKEAA